MKKLQLLFAAMLIGLTTATASEIVSETKTLSLDKQGEDFTVRGAWCRIFDLP